MLETIIQTTLFCFFIQVLSSEILWKYSTNYRYFPTIEKFRCDNRIVALIQSLITPILVIIAICHDGYASHDDMQKYSYMTRFCVNASTGYFLWDMVVCFIDNNLSYTFHAVFCFVIYLIASIIPEVTMFVCLFLLYELSTPFGHIRWFMLRFFYPYDVNNIELLFGATFIFVRIIIGLPMQFIAGYLLYHKFIEYYNVFYLLLLCGNVGMGCLNIYWSRIILRKFYLLE